MNWFDVIAVLLVLTAAVDVSWTCFFWSLSSAFPKGISVSDASQKRR
jgi:hypothetical protein